MRIVVPDYSETQWVSMTLNLAQTTFADLWAYCHRLRWDTVRALIGPEVEVAEQKVEVWHDLECAALSISRVLQTITPYQRNTVRCG